MTSKLTREELLNIIETDHVQCGEASALARMALAAMDGESGCLPLDYLQGHKDGLEWAAQLAEANHPETGDWLYDDPIELAKAIRKGPDMPPAQPVADSEPVAYIFKHPAGRLFWSLTDESNKGHDDVMPVYAAPQPAMVAPVCTCPSGDGSLRWPCPVYPGNSPAIPEGYKLVPTELTSEMVKAFRSFCEAYDVDLIAGYKAMLAAAPQEVK